MTNVTANSAPYRFAVVVLTLALAAVTLAAPASAAAFGTLRGTVTAPQADDPNWWQGVAVEVVDESIEVSEFAELESDGTYVIDWIPTGSYTVTIRATFYYDAGLPVPVNLISEHHPNVLDASDAVPVTVTAGATTTVNAELESGGTVTGTVVAPNASQEKWRWGADIVVEDDDHSYTAELKNDGTYVIAGIPAGQYRVRFAVGTYFDHFIGSTITVALRSEYYADARTAGTSTPITVTSGAVLAGIDASLEAPDFTSRPTPTFTGGTSAGSVQVAKPGTWVPAATLSYQWLRNGAVIPGATHATYRLVVADRGTTIALRVTGAAAGYETSVRTSLGKAIPRVFTTAPTPKITGTAKVGRTVTAVAGTWSPSASRTYQWYRNGVAIKGATKYTYKLTSVDRGRYITVKVTGKKAGYTTVVKTSARTKAVAR